MNDRLKIDHMPEGFPNDIDFSYKGFNYNLFLGVIKSKVGETRGECFLRFDDDQILRLLKDYMEMEHNKRQTFGRGIPALKRKQKELEASWERLTAWIRGHIDGLVPKP